MDTFKCKNCGEEIVRMNWMRSADTVKCINCDKATKIPDFPEPDQDTEADQDNLQSPSDESESKAPNDVSREATPLIMVEGRAKTLTVHKSKVCIAPSSGLLGGAFALAGEGTCEVRIKNITSIEFTEATTLKMGYLVINYPGAPAGRHGMVSAEDNTNRNNSLTFSKGANAKMREAKKIIEKLMEDLDASQESRTTVGLIQQNNTKWEYRVVKHKISSLNSESVDTTEGLQEKLNKLGRDRWEISASYPIGNQLVITLKRPML